MRGAVRDILRQAEKSGLPGHHHFFISYRTDMPGVEMSDMLRGKYPKEITIVLQHQFWDLNVEQDRFQVSLSFNNIPERLVVPFTALTGFADPSTKFGLKFHQSPLDDNGETELSVLPEPEAVSLETQSEEDKENKVVALDAFRKK